MACDKERACARAFLASQITRDGFFVASIDRSGQVRSCARSGFGWAHFGLVYLNRRIARDDHVSFDLDFDLRFSFNLSFNVSSKLILKIRVDVGDGFRVGFIRLGLDGAERTAHVCHV